jgi:hypothetical protein
METYQNASIVKSQAAAAILAATTRAITDSRGNRVYEFTGLQSQYQSNPAVIPPPSPQRPSYNQQLQDYINRMRNAAPEVKEAVKKDMMKRALISPSTASQGDAFLMYLDRYYSGPETLGSATSYAARVASGEIQLQAVDPILNQDTRVTSLDPAYMRNEAIKRRADAQAAFMAGHADEFTLKETARAEKLAIINQDTISVRGYGLDAASSLAKGLSDVKNNLEANQAARGVKPLAKPKPPKPVNRKAKMPKPTPRR